MDTADTSKCKTNFGLPELQRPVQKYQFSERKITMDVLTTFAPASPGLGSLNHLQPVFEECLYLISGPVGGCRLLNETVCSQLITLPDVVLVCNLT